MPGDRNIKMGDGNYNENIQGDYIQGDKNDVNQSRSFTVGDVGGDFNPTASPIMSDDAQISETVAGATDKQPSKKKFDIGIIIAVIGIVVAVCISGLFNSEVRQWLKLDRSPQTQEAPKNQ